MKDLLTYSKNLLIAQSEELIIEEAKRNPKKFEPLYRKYYKRIFTMLVNRTGGDKELAAELASNVFFKALSTIKKYTYQGNSIYTWLYKIALNESNDYFRKSGKKQYVVMDLTDFNLLSEEIALYGEEYREALKEALVKLKIEDLQLIQMRFFEEMPFAEIGEVLGLTEGHSKVKLYRAVEKLRKLMKVS